MAGLALFVVSCGVPSEDGGSETSVTTKAPTTTTENWSTTSEAVTTEAPITTPETPVLDVENLTEAAIYDLSRRLHTTEDNIEVVEAGLVQWPDGSIGCPEEGQMYTQAIVDGARILLSSAGRIYDYHAGSSGEVFICPSEAEDGGYDSIPPPESTG